MKNITNDFSVSPIDNSSSTPLTAKLSNDYTYAYNTYNQLSLNNNNNNYIYDNKLNAYRMLSPYNNTDTIEIQLSSLFSFVQLDEGTLRSLLADTHIHNYINFDVLTKTQILSEKFVNDYYDHFSKDILFEYQRFDEKFIESHISEFIQKDKCNSQIVNLISSKQAITFNFINKYKEYLNYSSLFHNHNLQFTLDFLLENKKYFSDKDYYDLINISNINEIINDLIQNLDFDELGKLNWNFISWNIDLNEDSIYKSLEYLDFYSVLLKNRKFKNEDILCYRILKYGC